MGFEFIVCCIAYKNNINNVSTIPAAVKVQSFFENSCFGQKHPKEEITKITKTIKKYIQKNKGSPDFALCKWFIFSTM
jgi:hypothetical protein